MNVGPFPVAAVIERLRTRVPELKLVDGAAGLLAAEKQQPSTYPAAFVVANERGGASKGYTGGVLAQPVGATCVVVIYVKHAGSAATGSKAQQQLDVMRGLIRNAVLNWKPMAGGTVLRFVASEGESYQGGSLQGQEAYGLDYTLEKGANP